MLPSLVESLKLGLVSCPSSSPQWVGSATGLLPTAGALAHAGLLAKHRHQGKQRHRFFLACGRYIYLQTFGDVVYIICQNLHLARLSAILVEVLFDASEGTFYGCPDVSCRLPGRCRVPQKDICLLRLLGSIPTAGAARRSPSRPSISNSTRSKPLARCSTCDLPPRPLDRSSTGILPDSPRPAQLQDESRCPTRRDHHGSRSVVRPRHASPQA